MSIILNLYRLQQVDTQIDHFKLRSRTIKEILENDAELKSAQQNFDRAETDKLTAERNLRQAEGEVTDQKIKIEQAESNLYSGRIQNPKELQDLQNDVASLKRYLTTLENRQLEAMIAIDEAQDAYTSAQSHLGTVQARVKAQNKTLTNEQDDLQHQLQRLDTERQAVFSTIDKENASIYEQLRQNRHGVAVTTVDDGACNSCGAPLPPGLIQQAKSTLTRCTGCSRILFINK